MNGYIPSRINPKLKQLIELVQDLYKVRVGMTPSDYKNDQLVLYTDSQYPGLSELKFLVTEKNEDADLQNHINRLENNPKEAMRYAKQCMLQYWIGRHPKLTKFLFNRQYQHLLESAADSNVSIQDFEGAIKRRKFPYLLPRKITQVERIIEPTVLVKNVEKRQIVNGKLIEKAKTLEEGDLVEKKGNEYVYNLSFDLPVDPVDFGKKLIEKSKSQQKRLEEEQRKEQEKTKYIT